jgi:hypothetical protein
MAVADLRSVDGVHCPDHDWVIPAQFEEARDLCEELAAVKSGGKWGFVDRTGPPVSIRGKWGFVDKTGKVVIAPQFESVGAFAKD